MVLSEKNIRDWVNNNEVFFQGKDYWLKRMVKAIRRISDDEISAVVMDSERFEVGIRFGAKKISSHCSCACEGGVCKHVVAVLLQWGHQEAVAAVRGVPLPLSSPQAPSAGPDDLFVDQAPYKVRLEITSLSVAGLGDQGTKAKIRIIDGHGQKISDIEYLRDYVDSSMEHDGIQWEMFNDSQQYFLNLLASFQQPYQQTYLKPFQLSLVLNIFAEMDGVELYAGAKQPLQVCSDKPLEARIMVDLAPNSQLRTLLEFPDPNDLLKKLAPIIIDGRPMWGYLDGAFKFVRLPKGLDRPVLNTFGCNTEMIFEKDQTPQILKTIEGLKSECSVIYKSPELEKIKPLVLPLLMKAKVDYDGKYLTITPVAVYGEYSISLEKILDRDEFTSLKKDGQMCFLQRDLQKEAEVMRFFLRECGLDLAPRAEVLRTAQHDLMAGLVYQKLPQISERCEISISENVQKIFHGQDVMEPFVSVRDGAGIDWFEYDIGFSINGQDKEISYKQIQEQLMQGKNYLRLGSGEFVRLDQEKYKTIDAFIDEYGASKGRLSSAHLPYLAALGQEGRLDVKLGSKAKDFYGKLKSFRAIAESPVPATFKGVLRDYQALGLDWLEFLREFGFGGILADDMGLGKTVQVLAILLKCKQEGVTSPSLVVCPTTLVLNWEAEIQKFAPDLKVLVLVGKDRRSLISSIGQYDLVLTSYAIMRRDAELYSKERFYYIILDEAQHIKNRHTLNAQMTKSLSGANRLVLTGTPIENSIADLWSIFDFLMPGYLGKYENFREFYEQPILLGKDHSRLELLSRKIKPFLLRRLKKDVAKELPPKIEQVSLCEMGAVQQRAYAAMVEMGRRQINEAFASKGFNKSRMLILTVLLRLRQICCHPRLAGVDQGPKFSVAAKLNLFKELLDEAMDAGHRVLVFSQFVGMLDIIDEYLKRSKIDFERLDGRSRERAAIVERFNQGKAPVFLLSLKVGGVGLNLTSADTVVLFEPWWNPAVEDQAIDRAYRIGQQKQVMAYKLICKGTIEEKILELQKRKKNLVDSLVISEESMGKSLGWDDVKFLLDI